ncbi:unnamed protein product [Rhizopus microsporus]
MSKIPNLKLEEDLLAPSKIYKNIVPTAITSTTTGANLQTATPPQKSVPAFLNKLFSMVNDPSTDDLICWAENGKSFFVNRQEDFARKVLPRFFKHNKFSSFVRQLNMYGFHKVPHLQQGVLETDSDSERWEFSNPNFQRNKPELLTLVTRKKGVSADEKELSGVDLQHILEEIKSIKRHQMSISTQLQNIQRDNQILWQETVQARERHLRHQETIDKILQFLASVFSSSGAGEKRNVIPRKRRFLLGPGESVEQETEPIEGAIVSNEDDDNERPTKQQKQQNEALFNINDYVNDVNDQADEEEISNPIPTNIPANDLQDAIALNNKSKIADTPSYTPSYVPNLDFSNMPQLQNLQHLITLAQSNPDLLNQLTSESLYGAPSQLTNVVASPAASLDSTSSSAPSLNQVTNNIANVSDEANAINQDIEELGLSLQALAQYLGFDPA